VRELSSSVESAVRFTTLETVGDVVAACGEGFFEDSQAVFVWDASTGKQLHSWFRERPTRSVWQRCQIAVAPLQPLLGG